MDLPFLTTSPGDPVWIAIAFLGGIIARMGGLPPLVGFLAAGFILNLSGVTAGPFLEQAANFGITLMLFTIGLKLDVRVLLRSEILAVSVIHMAMSIIVFGALGALLKLAGFLVYAETDMTAVLIVAFALSFSSTVLAVKTLEEKGAMASTYGKVAIGILVLQDIAAVIFLAITTGKPPSVYALLLFGLYPARKVIIYFLERTGHGELTILFGILAAVGGASLFELVDLKGDLGALILGMLLASSPKAKELSKNLLVFKDIFLICFFLTIGLAGLPDWEALGQSLFLVLLIPAKALLFLWLFLGFRLRARSAVLSSLTLGNYSEFGLIVAAISVELGLLSVDWLVTLALTVALSFVVSALLGQRADTIYQRYRVRLRKWQRDHHLPHDAPVRLDGTRCLVFGLGRTGTPAFLALNEAFEGAVLGVDMESRSVERFTASDAKVLQGDATNPEFWSRLSGLGETVELVVLAMPNKNSNLSAARLLRERGYTGTIAATAMYSDDVGEMRLAGIDDVFNLYAAAGEGLAQHLHHHVRKGDRADDDATGDSVEGTPRGAQT